MIREEDGKFPWLAGSRRYGIKIGEWSKPSAAVN
jgi:hypothetical protein